MSVGASADLKPGEAVFLTGVSALIDRYDGFIIDQWGVLHDGTTPYPNAAECLRRLRAAGKRIVILSNSGRREADNVRLMTSMGFAADSYDRFISAGEDARAALIARTDSFHRALGVRCYAFTRDDDRSLLDGIGLEFVDRIDDAEFLALIGTDSPRRDLVDYEPELRQAIARRLPMICANPDLLRLSPRGMIEAPGVLARHYEALGGEVFYHGKPHPAIFRSCLAALHGCAPDHVIAIGDSIEHDILGAARAGVPSALIAGGVHAPALELRWGELPTEARWRGFVANAAAKPDYVLSAFVW